MNTENLSEHPPNNLNAGSNTLQQKNISTGTKKVEPRPVRHRRYLNVHRLYNLKEQTNRIELDGTLLNEHVRELKTKLMNAYYSFAYQATLGYAWEISEDPKKEEFRAVGTSNGITWNLFVGHDRLALTRTKARGIIESISEVELTTDNPQGNSIEYRSTLNGKINTYERTETKNNKAILKTHALAGQLADFKPPRRERKKPDIKLVYSRKG